MSLFQSHSDTHQHTALSSANNSFMTKNSVSATDGFERLAQGITSTPAQDSMVLESPKRWWQKLLGLPAYYWVLMAQVVVIVPHVSHLPIWLIVYALFVIVAQLPRVKALRFAKKRLYQVAQILGFIAGVAGLWLSYQTAFGVDVGVAFLVLCLVSKLWEMYQRRDAYIVLNLSFFVLASLFLMDQGLLTTAEVVVGTLWLLFAFISLNDDGNLLGSGRLRSLGLLAGQAIPLLIILFLFFPRLPPLWSLQLSGQQATTGVSDSMSPGDFANLSQSTELAFRVEFGTQPPAQSQMYWRGLVFSDFDGVTWTPNANIQTWWSGDKPLWLQQAWQTIPKREQADATSYQVILEPTQRNWLYGLDYPYPNQRGTSLTSNFTLRSFRPVVQQLRYQVQRYPQMRIDTTLSEQARQINLSIPSEGNRRSQEWAKQMFADAGRDPIRYINAIQNWIGNTEFRYTLSPPALQQNRIDEFLFETKAGFCEHYASSFTYLMRAVGVPARVVAGYQGGELGRDGNSWEVRQMDAHAWSEVWLEGQGWVRIDPTAFVAPERVEQGMNALTSQQGATMFGTGAGAQISYQQFRMLQTLRRLSDQASYYWQRDVVGYDQDKQSNALLRWFNIANMMQQLLWMITALLLVIATIVFLIWYRRRKIWNPVDLPLVQLSKRVAKADPQLAYQSNEGMLAWLSRLEEVADSTEAKQAVILLKQDYRRLRYGKLSSMDTSSQAYQQALKQLQYHAKQIR
ncbi:transglutaminaseTgpA domain-containing protein [Psychrobacter sp. I-STPA6b]|uniref:transglutaminase family protein n=1 Tax=Psychrobacter sp. I-STPA6b TaxID=2585718 RepID=UPI001D0C0778|nr:DUF3488 and transglutaminase-like domain-containing protein [Psychrobacter sp. I-STPA6b]